MNQDEYFIELRVYLKPDTKESDAHELADMLQDKLADIVSDEEAPTIFTQDVKYEVVRIIAQKVN